MEHGDHKYIYCRQLELAFDAYYGLGKFHYELHQHINNNKPIELKLFSKGSLSHFDKTKPFMLFRFKLKKWQST